jgi:Protein of unknown function (DUF3017)
VKHSAKALARQAKAQRAAAAQGAGKDGESGGGRHLLAQFPYWLVLAGVVAGLATIRGGGQAVRGGTLVIAGALLAGSLARLVLPEGKAGMLGSRRRIVDVGILGILGIGLLVAGLIVAVPRS